MGAVTLKVADLDNMIKYYTHALPLQVIDQQGSSAIIGRGNRPLVILEHAPELQHASRRAAGLFHTAILFETETALAAALYTAAQYAPNSFTGSADHLVSKAFYFNDPEGNGIELYWDRDRSEWSWVHGQVEMDNLLLDPNQYLRDYLTEDAIQNPVIGGAEIGHVHLQVGDLAGARKFYVDWLGFDATKANFPGALFVSAGGYHHHMAMNIWNSQGAGRRDNTLGLGQVDIVLPSKDALGEVTERVKHYGVQVADDGRTVRFEDPWANELRIQAADA
ncbi:VOC family protein [Enteractinococcus fodinae]|nr:VOC family protein [Enteractinococcus fodinae]